MPQIEIKTHIKGPGFYDNVISGLIDKTLIPSDPNFNRIIKQTAGYFINYIERVLKKNSDPELFGETKSLIVLGSMNKYVGYLTSLQSEVSDFDNMMGKKNQERIKKIFINVNNVFESNSTVTDAIVE